MGRPGGEIGRHAILRGWCRKASRFESASGHVRVRTSVGHCHSSSVVEHSIRNRAVKGSIPFCGSGGIGRVGCFGIAGVTQLVECQLPKLKVAGSSPVSRFLAHNDDDRHAPLPISHRSGRTSLYLRAGTDRSDNRRAATPLLSTAINATSRPQVAATTIQPQPSLASPPTTAATNSTSQSPTAPTATYHPVSPADRCTPHTRTTAARIPS
jgi:hypothetical protein